MKRNEIRIRDPFIFTDNEAGCYYMFGSIDLIPGTITTTTKFSVYKSYDLENFEGPKIIFDGSGDDFWADRDFWAPEVHKYNGKYYLFGTCNSEDRCRGTQIFVSSTVDGEYKPLSDGPVTPEDWDCLDGTLYVEGGTPYMVFCHEWAQIGDGEICAVELSDDLSHPVGEPFVLFRASEAKDVGELEEGSGNYVTDGPFLYNEDGKIKMIWSSFSLGRYLILGAESTSLCGEWEHTGSKFDFDGGHAMLFTALNGKRTMAYHTPNYIGEERAKFREF